MKNLIKFILPLFAFAFMVNSCVEEDFDQPPTTGGDVDLTVTTTIAELLSKHTLGDGPTAIEDDLIIKGTVIADDFSGNWYRSFVIQDETAGLTVLIDQTESYFLYPIGREVFIKLKGLSLDDYNNLVQLGVYNAVTGQLDDITEATGNLVRGQQKGAPTPKVMSVNQLTQADVNTLVQFDDVMFTNTSGTYADAAGQNSLNQDLTDCSSTVLVRTSGFADFAGTPIASGGGTFVGVVSIFRDDFQLLIRNLDDLDMEGERCDGSGGTDCNGGTVPTVSGVDEQFENGSNNDGVSISGWTNAVVKGSRNWIYKEFSGNVYVQASAFQDNNSEMETWLITPLIEITDQTKILTFETAKAFYTHDGFSAWLSTDFECDPTEAVWTPLGATLAGQSDDDNAWVSSGDVDLTSLIGQKIAIGFKYIGSGTGGQTGSFRIDNLKLGEGGGNTGGNDDPCTNGNGPLEVSTIDMDFSNGGNNDEVTENGWVNIAEVGTRNWIYKEFSGNVYIQSSAFNDDAPETKSWIVTPLINATATTTLSFETAKAFWTHDGLTVWTSTDYECDPLTATWTPLTATLAGQNDADHDWVSSGDIDLSDFAGGTVAIGFKYEGNNNAGETASFRVDNLKVTQ